MGTFSTFTINVVIDVVRYKSFILLFIFFWVNWINFSVKIYFFYSFLMYTLLFFIYCSGTNNVHYYLRVYLEWILYLFTLYSWHLTPPTLLFCFLTLHQTLPSFCLPFSLYKYIHNGIILLTHFSSFVYLLCIYFYKHYNLYYVVYLLLI